jgi:hypothetical protein
MLHFIDARKMRLFLSAAITSDSFDIRVAMFPAHTIHLFQMFDVSIAALRDRFQSGDGQTDPSLHTSGPSKAGKVEHIEGYHSRICFERLYKWTRFSRPTRAPASSP